MNEDMSWMFRALALAEHGLYSTTPNPRVGCVLVKEGICVGEGFHLRAGQPHAEVMALSAAGEAARGATAYVTLEPCSHFGRTPPCSDALINAGVIRVVVAMRDPNPLVSGGGIKRLEAAGIKVDCGVLAEKAGALNIGFVWRHQLGRPFIRSKIGATLDGKTAVSSGESRWITGEDARIDVHRWRARSCAVLTGIGTILEDNPELTVRHVPTTRQPLRIVVDSSLRFQPDHKMACSGTHVVTLNENIALHKRFEDRGVIISVVESRSGQVSLDALMALMARMELNEVLVEAGPTLNGALLDSGFIDELIIYFAPLILKEQAKGMFTGRPVVQLDQAEAFRFVNTTYMGEDLRVIARRQYSELLQESGCLPV